MCVRLSESERREKEKEKEGETKRATSRRESCCGEGEGRREEGSGGERPIVESHVVDRLIVGVHLVEHLSIARV